MYLHVSLCQYMYVCVLESIHRDHQRWWELELESQVIVSFQTWAIGNERESSTRAASTLNYWAISITLVHFLIYCRSFWASNHFLTNNFTQWPDRADLSDLWHEETLRLIAISLTFRSPASNSLIRLHLRQKLRSSYHPSASSLIN